MVRAEALAELKVLSERVRELRRRRGWGQGEYAAKTGLTANYVNQVENATLRSIPKRTTLAQLAQPFGVTVSELIGDEPLPARETPYDTNADIRALADALNARPSAARYLVAALRSLGVDRLPAEDNVLEFVPARLSGPPRREMTDRELRNVAAVLGEVVEFRKGALWKEYEVPLVATVSAGSGIEIFETYEKVRQIPEYYWNAGARAVFKVKGHSMLDMGITDNDLLFVKPTEKAKHGQVVICSLNGSAFVKELQRDATGVRLASKNPDYQPMPVGEQDDLRIFGIVLGRTGNLMSEPVTRPKVSRATDQELDIGRPGGRR